MRGNVLWLPAKETFKRLLRSWNWGKLCPQLNFRNRGRWSCSGDCFLSQVNHKFSGWCFLFKQMPVVELLVHESINSWWKQLKGTGQKMCQDRILGSVYRGITHKGTKLILRLYLAQEKQGKCGRRWLREDIRDRSISVSRRLSYWYGTFVSYGISSTMFKDKLHKYLLSIVRVFGIQFAHEILFLFPIILIRLRESYE